jgi:hypothetical protein
VRGDYAEDRAKDVSSSKRRSNMPFFLISVRIGPEVKLDGNGDFKITNVKLCTLQRCGREILVIQYILSVVMFATVRIGRLVQITVNCVVSANLIVALRQYFCLCSIRPRH